MVGCRAAPQTCRLILGPPPPPRPPCSGGAAAAPDPCKKFSAFRVQADRLSFQKLHENIRLLLGRCQNHRNQKNVDLDDPWGSVAGNSRKSSTFRVQLGVSGPWPRKSILNTGQRPPTWVRLALLTPSFWDSLNITTSGHRTNRVSLRMPLPLPHAQP